MTNLLFKHGEDWNQDLLYRCYEAVEDIALNDMGLDIYPNQFVIIPSEDMLDAYASIGLPFMYQHWSFGQDFKRHQAQYRRTGSLAYELVINSNPCVSWNMASNTTTHMVLVMAHAAFGHNHFFKNNYLFKEWTNADGMIDYLHFARDYIHRCEERYGYEHVEMVLDAAHALQRPGGVFRSKQPRQTNPRKEEARLKERMKMMEESFNSEWRDLIPRQRQEKTPEEQERDLMRLPEENILYFLEKYSPGLKPFEREILRIVRNLAQYFYPQGQTQVMNEGCATFTHKYIMEELRRRGRLDDATMFEFYQSHAGVVKQYEYRELKKVQGISPFASINPYYLGWKMCEDIRRVATNPTAEDRKWFSRSRSNESWVGKDNWRQVLLDAWQGYRDESFIRQFLTPKLIRDMRLFSVRQGEDYYMVEHIHREGDYEDICEALAENYEYMRRMPDIQVTGCNMKKDRLLTLTHFKVEGQELDAKSAAEVKNYIELLWGYPVDLIED